MPALCKQIIAAAALGFLSVSVALAADAGALRDARKETFSLHSKATKDDHVVRVWFPEGYQAASTAYPLLLMLDGEYGFNSAVDISDYMQRDGAVRPYIIVALSYDVGFGPPLAVKRSRDFTPPRGADGIIAKTPTAYHTFLKEELLPALKARYRINLGDLTLWSYSLSGAFAFWLNYYDRALFSNYIIASPNSSYGILEKLMAGEIFNGDAASAQKVIMTVDRSEIDAPDNYFKPNTTEPTEELKQFLAQAKGYRLQLHGTQGESHATSWMVSLPTGLRYVFGAAKKAPAGEVKK